MRRISDGEVARGQASKAVEWLVERGRSGTEELAEMVRREIREQVNALGLATKDDVARLEAQLEEVRARATNAATPTASAAAAPRSSQPSKAPAKAASRARKADEGTTGSAGISRSGSVRKRSGATASAEAGATPPAGGADPKG